MWRHPFNVALGEVLREAREARGFQRQAVAKISRGRWTASAIKQYEIGDRGVCLANLADLCVLYDVNLAVVLDRAERRFRARQNPAVDAWRRHVAHRPSTVPGRCDSDPEALSATGFPVRSDPRPPEAA